MRQCQVTDADRAAEALTLYNVRIAAEPIKD